MNDGERVEARDRLGDLDGERKELGDVERPAPEPLLERKRTGVLQNQGRASPKLLESDRSGDAGNDDPAQDFVLVPKRLRVVRIQRALADGLDYDRARIVAALRPQDDVAMAAMYRLKVAVARNVHNMPSPPEDEGMLPQLSDRRRFPVPV